MLWDSRLGAQVTTRDQFNEAAKKDRAAAAEIVARLAEERDLHVEIGQLSHDGPPFFVAVMPRVVKEGLMAAQHGPAGETRGAPKQLKYGAPLIGLPGYTEGQFLQVEAVNQALANYEAHISIETVDLPIV